MGLRGVRNLAFLCTVVCALFGVAFSAQSCTMLQSSNRGFQACQTLPRLASTLAWTIHNGTNTVDFAYSSSAPSPSGWVGWGINPTAAAMVGTQSLIAFQSTQGAVVYTYPITGPIKGGGSPCVPGNISLDFTGMSAEISGTEMTIFATLNLKPNETLSMNHVWNQGSTVDLTTNAVGPHAMTGDSLLSMSSIDLASNTASNIQPPNQKLKERHGLIGAVAWGLLLPLGVMAARYLRPLSGSNPAWFYIHVACQSTGYILGVVSWAMGMRLHTLNEGGAVPTMHRNIGISIFALATLQVLAIVLRPHKDAKYRKYWNIYHHSVGYATIILIIINIFEGLDLLQPGDRWTNAYIVVVTVLGAISLVMEIITWSLWLRQRSKDNATSMYNGSHRKAGTGNAYNWNGQEKTTDAV